MDQQLTIILLGSSKVGKSASGNTILGRSAFDSRVSFREVTTRISEETEEVFGRQISVIDTPEILGLEQQIRSYCDGLRQPSRPLLFLLVVKIDPSIIGQQRALEAAIRIIGEQNFHSCYLLFTGGDALINTTVEDFMNEDPDSPLPSFLRRFAGRHHVFNNINQDQEQVRQLLLKAGHLSTAAGCLEGRRMVLLGLPGDGKSTSGNTILGNEAFRSGCSFEMVTRESHSASASVEGRKLTVVDTPGFSGEALSPRKLYEEIVKSVKEARPGPHVFLLVVRIGRINEANTTLLKMIPKLFGNDTSKYTMILFTHGDELKQESIEDVIESSKFMSQLVSRCGNRYSVFDNTKSQNGHQVRKLLDQIDEMVSGNGGRHYTAEMFHDVQKIPVKLSIKWQEVKGWFIQKIQELDCSRRHRGYNQMQEMEDLSE